MCRLLIPITVFSHAVFIVFLTIGGLFYFLHKSFLLLHLTVFIYSIFIGVCDVRCPLTRLEIYLRKRRGQAIQWQSFADHYILDRFNLTSSNRRFLFTYLLLIMFINSFAYFAFLQSVFS